MIDDGRGQRNQTWTFNGVWVFKWKCRGPHNITSTQQRPVLWTTFMLIVTRVLSICGSARRYLLLLAWPIYSITIYLTLPLLSQFGPIFNPLDPNLPFAKTKKKYGYGPKSDRWLKRECFRCCPWYYGWLAKVHVVCNAYTYITLNYPILWRTNEGQVVRTCFVV